MPNSPQLSYPSLCFKIAFVLEFIVFPVHRVTFWVVYVVAIDCVAFQSPHTDEISLVITVNGPLQRILAAFRLIAWGGGGSPGPAVSYLGARSLSTRQLVGSLGWVILPSVSFR